MEPGVIGNLTGGSNFLGGAFYLVTIATMLLAVGLVLGFVNDARVTKKIVLAFCAVAVAVMAAAVATMYFAADRQAMGSCIPGEYVTYNERIAVESAFPYGGNSIYVVLEGKRLKGDKDLVRVCTIIPAKQSKGFPGRYVGPDEYFLLISKVEQSGAHWREYDFKELR